MLLPWLCYTPTAFQKPLAAGQRVTSQPQAERSVER
jgi:hypothetical protein